MKKVDILELTKKKLAESINLGWIPKESRMDSWEKGMVLSNISATATNGNEEYCSIYKMDCESGLGLMTVYQVYPGIQLIYNDFEATHFTWGEEHKDNIMEINHCREGREGSQLKSGSCLYLGEGDLSVHMMDNCAPSMSFPLRHYRGIAVAVDLDKVAAEPPEVLRSAGIDFMGLRKKFCSDGTCMVIPARDQIEHIFSELYSVPEAVQEPYFKLKVQELLIFLNQIDVIREKHREQYLSPQVEIIKRIHKRLVENMQERPTIDELSKDYHINTFSLKTTFKGVYVLICIFSSPVFRTLLSLKGVIYRTI